MSSKAIILIQTIEAAEQFAFDYPLEQKLKGEGFQVITIDSLSDRSILQPVLKAINENREMFLILDCRLSKEIGIGQSILNACIKNKNLKLIFLGEPGKATPFLKLFNGKTFSDEHEVIDYINSN